MTSKEAIKNIKEKSKMMTKQGLCFYGYVKEDLNTIEKDLEELAELKKLMGTPIQDIMKRLKVLEILKEHISFKIDERQCDKYLIKMVSEDTGNYTYIRLYEEECNKLLEVYLDGKD